MFNQFNIYAMQAGDLTHSCDDKILVDLKRLESIRDLEEVQKYVDKVWGEFDESKQFEYPNDVVVLVEKGKDSILIGALKENKQIFGRRWRLETEEEMNKRLAKDKA